MILISGKNNDRSLGCVWLHIIGNIVVDSGSMEVKCDSGVGGSMIQSMEKEEKRKTEMQRLVRLSNYICFTICAF